MKKHHQPDTPLDQPFHLLDTLRGLEQRLLVTTAGVEDERRRGSEGALVEGPTLGNDGGAHINRLPEERGEQRASREIVVMAEPTWALCRSG